MISKDNEDKSMSNSETTKSISSLPFQKEGKPSKLKIGSEHEISETATCTNILGQPKVDS